ncbi:MAG TPA: DNRLRE domain-containing protein, partial [Chloroflexia bacterium]|nr:DNRLRE domain-containing protein [Chloroflexia bacterium]
TSSSGVLLEYPSLIGLDGNSDVQGGQMWLYYMKVEAGATMTGDTRYLIRRPFSIDGGVAPTNTTLPSPTATSIPSNTATPVPPTQASTVTTAATASATASSTATQQPEASHTATRMPESTQTTTLPTHTATRQSSSTPTSIPASPTATPTASVGTRYPSTQTFYAAADATLRQDQPDTNLGTSSNLHVDDEKYSDLRAYLKFSVSGVSGTVQGAKLRVYAYGGTVNGPALYGSSNTGWSETGITWNTRPAATTGIVDDKGAIADNVWVEYNVQPLLSSGGNGTYTFILMAYSPDAAHFYSRQAALYEGKAHLVPQLVLTVAGNSANALTNTQASSTQEAQQGYAGQFTDLPVDSPYYGYVNVAVAECMIGGYSDGTFRSNDPISRGQLSKIVALALDYGAYAGDYLVEDLIIDTGPSGTLSNRMFQDVPADSPYFNYIGKLARAGIIGGYACGTRVDEPCVGADKLPYFRASASASRGQIAKIVSTAAGFSRTGVSNSAMATQMFEDVGTDSAFFTYVQDLVAQGVMSGYACGGNNEPCSADQGNRPYFRPNKTATRGQLTKIVVNTFFP